MDPLVDSFGRVVADLRISVTDRCNFRCTYCMPASGMQWLVREAVLTVDEIGRIASVFVERGVRAIKVTGGEPTARQDLAAIVARLRAIDPRLDLSLTTNGYLLETLAAPLRDAGLDRVTVSCDSLLRHRFAEITRRDAFDQVMRGLEAARRAGFAPIKLNCVVIAGTNDDEVLAFARLARDTGLDVRFIEYMPLDADHRWERAKVVSTAKLRELVESAFPLAIDDEAGPATRFAFADGTRGSVGFISSVTAPFCASCDRVRITADGQLRACLFAVEETDLRGPLRGGASDEELARLVRRAVAAKWAGHRIDRADFVRPARSMSQIGG